MSSTISRSPAARTRPCACPRCSDDALDGQAPDVLIIGGGISGVSIARELTRQKLDILVVDKECDLALGASGRNDGEVHPGIDLGRGSVKHKYIRRGNAMYDQVCKELNVPFSRVGQYVCFQHGWLRPAVWGYCMWRRYHDGIADTEPHLRQGAAASREPNFNPKTRFAISNPDSGCVCPYGLTIAYAENAVQNGARIALNTAVLGMDVADGKITAVHTNRGTLHPALVINAAGVFAEDVARMAGDRFFSIHPRRGTNSILDRKAGAFMHSIASVKGNDMVSKTHSKGGGILHTVHDNLLIGPDAVETYEKENTATYPESIAHVFSKQKITMPALTERDIITYFTGVRAPTFEEDFIIERGRHTHNLIHVAGIQSPGLTTAPAVAEDVADMAVRILARERPVAVESGLRPPPAGHPRPAGDGRRDARCLHREKPRLRRHRLPLRGDQPRRDPRCAALERVRADGRRREKARAARHGPLPGRVLLAAGGAHHRGVSSACRSVRCASPRPTHPSRSARRNPGRCRHDV